MGIGRRYTTGIVAGQAMACQFRRFGVCDGPGSCLAASLYRAAKADPGEEFHALSDKAYRTDVLERAWVNVRRNGGAAGIDRKTITDVQEYGVSRLLDELVVDLNVGRWRPQPARRVFIPKPVSRELRPLSIPTVRDRAVTGDAPASTSCSWPVGLRTRQCSMRVIGSGN